MLSQDPFHSLNPIEDLAKAGIESSSNLPGDEPTIRFLAKEHSAVWASWASHPHSPGLGPQLRPLCAG